MATINTESQGSPGHIATMRFLRDRPEWLPVVVACLVEASRTAGHGFAGAWVLKEAHRTSGVEWFPNLRPLVSAGILERTEVSRGGKRAYYVLRDPAGVGAAVQRHSAA